jgi:hypothetical protein
MKISYRTHPHLKILHDGLKEFDVHDRDMEHFKLRAKSGDNLCTVFNDNIQQFASKILHLSKPFCEAINLSAKKILNFELIEKYFADKAPKGTISFFNYSIFYNMEKPIIAILAGSELIFFLKGGDDINNHITYFSESHYSNELKSKYEYKMVVGYVFYQLFSILAFVKLCPVESKEIKAQSKVKSIGCKYINDTDLNIEYLDSKWFTTLVKSDAFKVRGHFRLQPCGEGLKDRKLIWINDFQKEGYTAPARKLNQTA